MNLEGFPKELTDPLHEHLRRYLETDGEDGYLWDSTVVGGAGVVTTLILRTIGRKSGNELVTPLIFGEEQGEFVVVASKAGYAHNPAWVLEHAGCRCGRRANQSRAFQGDQPSGRG